MTSDDRSIAGREHRQDEDVERAEELAEPWRAVVEAGGTPVLVGPKPGRVSPAEPA